MGHCARKDRGGTRLPRAWLCYPRQRLREPDERPRVHRERLRISVSATKSFFAVDNRSGAVHWLREDMRVVNGAALGKHILCAW